MIAARGSRSDDRLQPLLQFQKIVPGIPAHAMITGAQLDPADQRRIGLETRFHVGIHQFRNPLAELLSMLLRQLKSTDDVELTVRTRQCPLLGPGVPDPPAEPW